MGTKDTIPTYFSDPIKILLKDDHEYCQILTQLLVMGHKYCNFSCGHYTTAY